jgi:hypothetical protein
MISVPMNAPRRTMPPVAEAPVKYTWRMNSSITGGTRSMPTRRMACIAR